MFELLNSCHYGVKTTKSVVAFANGVISSFAICMFVILKFYDA